MTTCRDCRKKMLFFFYFPKFCNFCGSANLRFYPVIEIVVLLFIAGAAIFGLTSK